LSPRSWASKPAEYQDIQALLRKEIAYTIALLGGGKDKDEDG